MQMRKPVSEGPPNSMALPGPYRPFGLGVKRPMRTGLPARTGVVSLSSRQVPPVSTGATKREVSVNPARLPFDGAEARALSLRIQEQIYLQALTTSCELARAHGPPPAFAETRASEGVFRFRIRWTIARQNP